MIDIVAWGGISFGFTAVIMIFFAAIAWFCKTDKVTDFAGCFTFIVLAVVGLTWISDYFARQIVLCSLVIVWALRLGLYLTTRILKRGKDERLNGIREVWWKFLLFWGTQITWVWVVFLPVMFIQATHEDKTLSACDYVGWAIWGVGLLIESGADFQRQHYHRRTDEKKPKFLNYGLWRYSRHPNYFGEVLCWLGIWLSSSYGLWGIDTAYGVVGLLSPLLTLILVAFITGVPIVEKLEDERYHQYPEYVQYKKETSPIWPCVPRLYAHMPMVLRKVIYLDIPDYTKLKRFENEETGAPSTNEPSSK